MKKAKSTEHVIQRVLPGSIARELEIEPGDVLVSVGGEPVEDIFDYRYLTNEEYLEVVIRKPSGEEWELEIEKEFEEDLGIEFENPLLDEYRSCRNACIFCFIDQMPKGMRDTLYFKDDDSRLSFLQGNYVTLTNMSDHDIDRIIRYRMEPINISFQTMNPQLRCKMLRNRFAGDVFPKIQRLCEAGIEMNGQIVLCKGVNDGEELEYSLQQMEQYVPHLRSVSVVPVGLTRFREGLFPLEPFTREDAQRVLEQIERWQAHYMQRYGTHLVHASDEWYFLAGRPMPSADSYDGYVQLENGVGMIRLLIDEVTECLERAKAEASSEKAEASAEHDGEAGNMGYSSVTGHSPVSEPSPMPGHSLVTEHSPVPGNPPVRKVSIATGELAADTIRMLAGAVQQVYPEVCCSVYAIHNDFFGEHITVAGLLTGQDLQKQLTGKDLGEKLLLPCNMLRCGENVFLDDMTVEELGEILHLPVQVVEADGESFVNALRLP